LSAEENLTDLKEVARRAGSIVTEHIDAMVERAEREAQDIRRHAEGDAERRAEDIRRKAEGDAQRKAEDILRHAESDGERTRRDAMEAARRMLERLHALERPLGELVMNLHMEMDRVAAELQSGSAVDAQSMELPESTEGERWPETATSPPPRDESEPEEEARADEEEAQAEPEPVEPEPEPEPEAEAEPEAEEPEAEPEPARVTEEPPAMAEPPSYPLTSGVGSAASGEPRDEKEGLFTRLRKSRGRPFITTEGHCAVCQRAFKAGSQENLDASGWLVSGDAGLCPNCQQDGWQLPEGARLPFRRGGT
jgi:hypothetical protein